MSLQKNLKSAQAPPSSPGSALRAAWWAYLILLFLPFLVLGVIIVSYSNTVTSSTPYHGVSRWFRLTTAFLVIVLPAALLYRRHLWRAYFRGDLVAPRRYLTGVLTVWLSLEVSMILTLVGCYVTVSFLPELLPAIVAFVVFITLWPSGKMMISRAGDSNDPEIYEMPR